MAVLLKRNAKVFISLVESGWTTSDTTRLNILEDFTFTQTASAAASVRSTIGAAGDRGLLSYTQETLPATFSFTTYFSTFSGILGDQLLWKALTNKADTSISIDFTESNVASLPEAFIYFDQGGITYKINNSVITGAAISMNLGAIPTITWSGTGRSITTATAPSVYLDEHANIPETLASLSTVAITRDSVAYSLALTAFSLELNNDVSWTSRKRLGKQSLPEAHFVGDRTITGNMSFYIKTGANASGTLFTNVLADNNVGASDKFSNVQVSLGADILISMPKALLINTDLQVEDVLTVSVPFVINQSVAGAADEITITVI